MTFTFSDIPVLQKSHVKMKNPEGVLKKIYKIVLGQKKSLQIISDFDLTITKQHVNGVKSHSSFGILTNWDQLPPGFTGKDIQLKAKYHPYEVNLQMTEDEKIPYMIEWYSECEKLWSGIKFNSEGLRKLIEENNPQLREGTVEMCKLLETNQIPILILSAGLGDVITEMLRFHGLVENGYFHIISNFFKIDNGVVQGYGCRENGFYIHPFNKNGVGCSKYFQNVSISRPNVILMGDSIGDAKMDAGVPKVETVLKIGFLYGSPKVDDGLQTFLDKFDIVLVDDQTMDVCRAIVDLVLAFDKRRSAI